MQPSFLWNSACVAREAVGGLAGRQHTHSSIVVVNAVVSIHGFTR